MLCDGSSAKAFVFQSPYPLAILETKVQLYVTLE
jgi:hypothetical protein